MASENGHLDIQAGSVDSTAVSSLDAASKLIREQMEGIAQDNYNRGKLDGAAETKAAPDTLQEVRQLVEKIAQDNYNRGKLDGAAEAKAEQEARIAEAQTKAVATHRSFLTKTNEAHGSLVSLWYVLEHERIGGRYNQIKPFIQDISARLDAYTNVCAQDLRKLGVNEQGSHQGGDVPASEANSSDLREKDLQTMKRVQALDATLALLLEGTTDILSDLQELHSNTKEPDDILYQLTDIIAELMESAKANGIIGNIQYAEFSESIKRRHDGEGQAEGGEKRQRTEWNTAPICSRIWYGLLGMKEQDFSSDVATCTWS